jgi:murein peptide amidase A
VTGWAGPAPAARGARPARVLLGRSERGRPIVAYRIGNPHGTPVLVVGCIHGTECAGIAIARALERVHTRLDLWVIPNLDPDGYAIGRRQNGRGVDLNENWSAHWRGGGRPWDLYYPGPRPFSERETRIARNLILRIRPRATIWFHQHMDLVWAWGRSSRAGRVYARASGMRFYHRHWLDGTAPNWQNHRLPGTASFVVELPAGSLSPAAVRRHVHAVLAVGGHPMPMPFLNAGGRRVPARRQAPRSGLLARGRSLPPMRFSPNRIAARRRARVCGPSVRERVRRSGGRQQTDGPTLPSNSSYPITLRRSVPYCASPP